MSESRPHDAPTGLGGYQVVRRLAVGGMAEVLLARQTVRSGIERLVVIKSILPGLSDQADLVSMFLSEARVASQLQHANVVQIHDVTRLGTRPCIVMEHLQGLDARRMMRRMGEGGELLPIGVVAAIGEGAAHGLGYAHRAVGVDGKPLSLVHRDVSPHNLFVTSDGVVKVLDFGIAKSSAQIQQTQQGTLKGKIAYMSPEQLHGDVLDGRSDLFSLGAVLWELATGKPLFAAGNDLETIAAVAQQPIPPPSSERPGIPEAFDRAVLWALSRDRDARPATGEDLARTLHAVAEATCDGPPVLATAKLVRDLLATAPPETQPESPNDFVTLPGLADMPPAARSEDASATDLGVAMTMSIVSAASASVVPPVAAATARPATAAAPTAPQLVLGDLRLEGLEGPGREEELPTKPRAAKPLGPRVVVTAPDPTEPLDADPAGGHAGLEVAGPAGAVPAPPSASSTSPRGPAAPPVVAPDVRDRFDPEGEDLGVAARNDAAISLAVDLDEDRRLMGRPLRDLDRRAAAIAKFGEPPFVLSTPLYAMRVLLRRAALARRAAELRAQLPLLEAEARDAQASIGRAVYESAPDRRIAREAEAVAVAVQGLEEIATAGAAGSVAERRRQLDAELSVEERLAVLGQAAVSRVAGANVTAPHEGTAREAAQRLEAARAELDLCEHGRNLFDTGAFRSGLALSFVIVATAATLLVAAFLVP